MGKYDSSKYRVVPLVDAIKCNSEKFQLFLGLIEGIPDLSCPVDEGAYFYGENEKKLNPTKEHLNGLIEYIATKEFKKISISDTNRADLYGLNGAERRKEAKEEALRLIEETYVVDGLLPKAWYIFEGPTNPDIYIEGKDYVIVCEGKWTESHITTKTTHLNEEDERRNQMVRHIQGALNATDKKVYAFYIVDESCGYKQNLTKAKFKEYLESETISPIEQTAIFDAYYGYTTWMEVASRIGVVFETKEQIDQKNKL